MSALDFVLGILAALIAEELFDYIDWLSRWLVRHSARRTPAELAVRLEEEWLADLSARPGKVSRLLFAVDSFRAAFRISADDMRAKRATESNSKLGKHERHYGEIPIEMLRESWLDYAHAFEQGNARPLLKRIFDLTIGSALLVFLAPVMALTIIALWLERSGPVLYCNERVGKGGRNFLVFKFRSVAGRSGVRDSTVTRLERFIYQTRIDELPLLFNVIRNEMSLVGPKPERPGFVDQVRRRLDFYDMRHIVKPGITGWAQVRNDGASLEDTKAELQFDLYYVKNNSSFLDLLILFETVSVVLTGKYHE